jgi:RNA polymerase sigma-70 factor (ECF subfamily)
MTMKADEVVQILLRWRLRIASVAAAIARDVHAADDIFQQVVLAALEDKEQFKDSDHLLAWAIRAARHRAIDLSRRRKMVSLPDKVLDLLEAEWTSPMAAGWPERVEALHRCVSRLGSKARELLQLKYADGLTVLTIAKQVRRSPEAIYQALSRIHRALRECVGRELGAFEGLAGRVVS